MNRQAEGFMAATTGGDAAGAAYPHESAHLHVSGEAVYVDDIPEIAGTLPRRARLSTRKPHAIVKSIDLTGGAIAIRVVAVSPCRHPGRKRLRPDHSRRSDLADGLVQYVGQPMFAVIADSYEAARRAARLATVEYEIAARDPHAAGGEASQSMCCANAPERGDPAAALAAAPHRIRASSMSATGTVLPGGSDFLRRPEGGRLHARLVLDAHPTEMQHVVAHALNSSQTR